MKTNKDLIIEPNAAIEGRKYSEEKPWSCKYCYWWGGKKKGCSLKQCHYLLPEKKKAAVGVRGIKLQKKDELEEVYLFEEGTETKITYGEKTVSLNRLKLAKRDGTGTKSR